MKQKRYKTVELIIKEKGWIPATITRLDLPVKPRIGFNVTGIPTATVV